MKPFNLADAKAGHPVQTRDGQAVTILKFDRRNVNHQLLGIVGDVDAPRVWLIDGQFSEACREHRYDLIMAPIGTIDNKPVYPGDMICVYGGEPFPAPYGPGAPMVEWERASWPVAYPVTQMTREELAQKVVDNGRSFSPTIIANAAIAHGIEHGYLIEPAVIKPLEQLVGGANPAETVSIAMAYLDGVVSQDRLRAIFVAGANHARGTDCENKVWLEDEIDQLIAQVK